MGSLAAAWGVKKYWVVFGVKKLYVNFRRTLFITKRACADSNTKRRKECLRHRPRKASAETGGKPRTFCLDIDGVIASITPANQYNIARPITGTVSLINYLVEKTGGKITQQRHQQ